MRLAAVGFDLGENSFLPYLPGNLAGYILLPGLESECYELRVVGR